VEASSLYSLLLNPKFRLERGDASQPWYVAVRAFAVGNGLLDHFKQALKTLQARMIDESRVKKAGEALMWKFKREEAAGVLTQMERLKTLIKIGLQINHL
jgi:hypothetical protein